MAEERATRRARLLLLAAHARAQASSDGGGDQRQGPWSFVTRNDENTANQGGQNAPLAAVFPPHAPRPAVPRQKAAPAVSDAVGLPSERSKSRKERIYAVC